MRVPDYSEIVLEDTLYPRDAICPRPLCITNLSSINFEATQWFYVKWIIGVVNNNLFRVDLIWNWISKYLMTWIRLCNYVQSNSSTTSAMTTSSDIIHTKAQYVNHLMELMIAILNFDPHAPQTAISRHSGYNQGEDLRLESRTEDYTPQQMFWKNLQSLILQPLQQKLYNCLVNHTALPKQK